MFTHFAADFVAQTDAQARAKYKDINALLAHVLTYSVIMGLGGLFFGFFNNITWFTSVSVFTGSLFFVLVFFTHFCIDFVTSKVNHRLWAQKRVHDFFVSVGFDQFLHFVSLVLIVKFLNT